MELEELFSQIEETIDKMQENDISLEDSFTLYENGMKALKKCNDKIDAVEKKLLKMDAEGNLEEV